MEYLRKVCFGCETHAKRIVLNKIAIKQEHRLFAYAIGMRNKTGIEHASHETSYLQRLGGKWNNFASWLVTNEVYFISH